MVATALSATVRKCSYARKDTWKLHRLHIEARTAHNVSAWRVFEERLRYCLSELSNSKASRNSFRVELRDARELDDPRTQARIGSFNVILTSPPYGDSRTTVQYGAASALCLEFVSRLTGLDCFFAAGSQIDSRCLGSAVGRSRDQGGRVRDRAYWAGRPDSPAGRAIRKFLRDYEEVCSGIAASLQPGGLAVLIVGRRSKAGYRLKLDSVTIDCMKHRGLKVVNIEKHASRQTHSVLCK